jgi:hypothetical protein
LSTGGSRLLLRQVGLFEQLASYPVEGCTEASSPPTALSNWLADPRRAPDCIGLAGLAIYGHVEVLKVLD